MDSTGFYSTDGIVVDPLRHISILSTIVVAVLLKWKGMLAWNYV